MKTDGTPLHGSYFDLATTKHPDLMRPERKGRRGRQPRHRRSRFGPVSAVFVGTLVGVVWLAIALRPEDGVRVAVAEQGSAVVGGPRLGDPVVGDRVVGDPAAVRAAAPVDPSVGMAQRSRSGAGDARVLAPPVPQRQVVGPPATRPTDASPVEETVVAERPVEPSVAERSVEPSVAERSVEPPVVVERSVEPPVVAERSVEPPAVAAFIPARKIFAPPLTYPEAALSEGEHGTVVIEAGIDASGVVTGTTIVRGRSPALDAAAVAALEAWRFEPARRGGVAVASTYRVGIKFALSDVAALSEADSEPSTPLEVGGEVKPPHRLEAPLPVYPNAAWVEGIAGDVLVRAVIDAKGEVADVEVLKGLPHGMTEAAVEAIRRWKFAPATRHGQPVAVYTNLSVRFEG